MNTLITPAEVFALAFSTTEPYEVSVVTALDVATAEERYLRPILGRELYDAMVGGSYTELRTTHVAPAVAAWTRYLIEPLLATRCGVCHGEGATTAENEALGSRRLLLRQRARTLSHQLTEYLNTSAAEFPEYEPKRNPLNRCFIDGNIVQIR